MKTLNRNSFAAGLVNGLAVSLAIVLVMGFAVWITLAIAAQGALMQ